MKNLKQVATENLKSEIIIDADMKPIFDTFKDVEFISLNTKGKSQVITVKDNSDMAKLTGKTNVEFTFIPCEGGFELYD